MPPKTVGSQHPLPIEAMALHRLPFPLGLVSRSFLSNFLDGGNVPGECVPLQAFSKRQVSHSEDGQGFYFIYAFISKQEILQSSVGGS